jgi:hypothetical protein
VIAQRIGRYRIDALLGAGGMGEVYRLDWQNDRAIEWCRRGIDERSPNMLYMKVGRPWDALRGDPRFQAILRQMNFPP